MNISLDQVAGILTLSNDEVMFLYQQNRLKAGVNQDTLKWEFDITEVLTLKDTLDKEKDLDTEE